MAFGEADLDIFTADLGVPVVKDGVSVNGVLRQEDVFEDQLGSMIQKRVTVVYLKRNAFASLKVEDAITVDGMAVRVRSVDLVHDGLFTKVTVALV